MSIPALPLPLTALVFTAFKQQQMGFRKSPYKKTSFSPMAEQNQRGCLLTEIHAVLKSKT
jgi:hypothetical protein